MDQNKRLLLFLVISAAVLFGWNVLFPPPKPQIRPAGADSAKAAATAPAAAPSAAPRAPLVVSAGAAPERLVTVRSPLYEYRFSTRGAALNAATLLRFESYVQKGGSVQLVPRSARDVLAQRVVVGRDTLDFRTLRREPGALGIVAQPRKAVLEQEQLTGGGDVQRRAGADQVNHLDRGSAAGCAFDIDDFVALTRAEIDAFADLLVQLLHQRHGGIADIETGAHDIAEFEQADAERSAGRSRHGHDQSHMAKPTGRVKPARLPGRHVQRLARDLP